MLIKKIFKRKEEINMQPVFDFHIHAVPEIDDGARSMEEALEILKIAASCGVTDAFCTSHSINFFSKINGSSTAVGCNHSFETAWFAVS